MPTLLDWISGVSPLSAGVAAAGGAALVALSLLRRRPQRRLTATVLFWQAAATPQTPWQLWSRRLGRLGSLALLLAIVGTLAAALSADPRGGHDGVIVIDAGRDMVRAASDGRTLLDHAAADAIDLSLAAGRSPAVLSAGDELIVRSPPGTPPAVSRAILADLKAGTTGGDPAAALALAGRLASGPIDWFTSRSVLPLGLSLETAVRVRPRRLTASRAIRVVSASAATDPSGRCRVDIRLQSSDRADGSCRVEWRRANGKRLNEAVGLVGGVGEVRIPDLAADGGTLDLEIDGKSGPGVRLTLPRDPRPVFQFAAEVPRPLREGLLAFGVEAGPDAPATVVVGGSPGSGQAAIRVVGVPRVSGDPPVVQAVAASGTVALPELTQAAAPEQWPGEGQALLTSGGRPVAGWSTDGRTLFLAESLVSETADLPRRATFVVLLRQWCDRLTGRSPAPSVVPADRAGIDPVWEDGLVNVVDGPTNENVPAADTTPVNPTPLPAVATVLLLAGLALLMVDALLWAIRRVA